MLLGKAFLLIAYHLFEFLVCIRLPSLVNHAVFPTRSRPTVTMVAWVAKAVVRSVDLRWSVELTHLALSLIAMLRWHPLAVVLIVGAGLDGSPVIHRIAIVDHLARF